MWVMNSRRRVFLVMLGLLLLLDLGRSLYARIGYAEPAEPWQEAPYESLAWPPGVDLPADAQLGERVYVERCAVCHGPDGEGNGPAAPSLIPRPRDFTLGQFKYKSTAGDQPPTDDDLYETIANGLQASAMPYFGDLLDDEEIRAVIDYVKDFSGSVEAAEPLTIPAQVTADESSIARGRELYQEHGCPACHGPDGRAGTRLSDARGYPVIARDLSAPWTFRGGSDPEQIWLRLSTGLSPSPMPSFADAMTPEERWHAVNYVLSLARIPPGEAGGELDGPGHQEDPVERGRYLIRASMCGLCHTQINEPLIYSGDDYYLAGGMGIPAYPQGVFVSPNLTSDPETGLGNWTVAEVVDAIRNGRAPDRTLTLWDMPWFLLHSLSDEDAQGVATYLKSLPPARNEIPAALRYGVVETLIAKALYSSGLPPLAQPDKLVYMDGNFGQTEPGLLPRDWPQRALIAGQWIILSLGLVAFLFAAPAEHRLPRSARGWILLALAVFGLLILILLGWTLYKTPALSFIPPEQVATAATSGMHRPDEASFDSAEQAALVLRGQYLFNVTSCALCHGNDGAGGPKISSRHSLGTTWTANITPDPQTGIGNWSDAEIARAIRSGIRPDGRQMHWQAMIWDHLSNLAEEDVRALIAYLRDMPPVVNEVPQPRPPSANDCEEYTFYVVETTEPGCD